MRPRIGSGQSGDNDSHTHTHANTNAEAEIGGPTGRVTERREVCSVTSVSGHTCTVEATNAAGSHAESGSATGTNAGPSLSISPGSGVGRTGFTATVNWSDSDGDSVSIAADTGGRILNCTLGGSSSGSVGCQFTIPAGSPVGTNTTFELTATDGWGGSAQAQFVLNP